MMEAEKEEKELTTHVSILPPETVGQVLQKLSVVDRLQCEGVNRRWKAAAWDLGWTEQTKLSREIVFEGARQSQQKKFDNDSLATLFRRVGANLIGLDLNSFVSYVSQDSQAENIFCTFQKLSNLRKLEMRKFNLREAVDFLPESLIDLCTNGPFDECSLAALSMSCPHLESIFFGAFRRNKKVSVSAMNTFFGKYQKSLKSLSLVGDFIGSEPNASLTSLGELEWLETLLLRNISVFDDAALTAVATGCRRLETLQLSAIGVSEEALNGLEEAHPTFMDFVLEAHPTLDETLQKAINGRWKTKKYKYLCSQLSTDIDIILVKVLQEVTAARERLLSTTASAHTLIDELIAWDFLPLLVKSLSSKIAELQLRAAQLLTDVTAFGTSAQKGAVVEAGAVPELLKLLGSTDYGPDVNFLREQLLRVLGNIIIDRLEFRDRCVELGILELLPKMVEANETSVDILELRYWVAWVYASISEWKDPPLPAEAVQAILPALGELIQRTEPNILWNSLWALSNIACGGNDKLIQLIVDSTGLVPRLVSLLDHSDEDVKRGALSAVTNISTGTQEQTQLLLDAGVLKMMPSLILYENEEIINNSVVFLANVAAEGEHRVQAVFDTGLVPVIIQLLVRCPHSRVHGVRAILNIAHYGGAVHVQQLVDFGVIHLFCKLLGENEGVDQNILGALKNILEKSDDARIEEVCEKIIRFGGLEKIRNLRNHESEDINKIAAVIIDIVSPSEEQI